METILIMALLVISNICCFTIGAKIGQKVQNREPVELPKIDPMQAYRDMRAEQESRRELDRMEVIMQNIDNYGTDKPQMDVPGR